MNENSSLSGIYAKTSGGIDSNRNGHHQSIILAVVQKDLHRQIRVKSVCLVDVTDYHSVPKGLSKSKLNGKRAVAVFVLKNVDGV